MHSNNACDVLSWKIPLPSQANCSCCLLILLINRAWFCQFWWTFFNLPCSSIFGFYKCHLGISRFADVNCPLSRVTFVLSNKLRVIFTLHGMLGLYLIILYGTLISIFILEILYLCLWWSVPSFSWILISITLILKILDLLTNLKLSSVRLVILCIYMHVLIHCCC